MSIYSKVIAILLIFVMPFALAENETSTAQSSTPTSISTTVTTSAETTASSSSTTTTINAATTSESTTAASTSAMTSTPTTAPSTESTAASTAQTTTTIQNTPTTQTTSSIGTNMTTSVSTTEATTTVVAFNVTVNATTISTSTVSTNTNCPQASTPIACPSGQEVNKNFDSNGCVVSYYCSQNCAAVMTWGVDGAGNCKEFSNACLPPGWTKVDKCPNKCGNGVCEENEAQTCPSDCRTQCPTYPATICEGGFIISGAYDSSTGCLGPSSCCGNNKCEGSENSQNCQRDCSQSGGSRCGNRICEQGENEQNCHDDCRPSTGWFCGNHVCENGEDRNICPSDCGGAQCGNGICDQGENPQNCISDCKSGNNHYCGNGICEIGEDVNNCHDDCGGGMKCPSEKKCHDGKVIQCKNEGNWCNCQPCPFSEDKVPQGCYQKTDNNGFVKVICEQVCPPVQDFETQQKKCKDMGGSASVRKDFRGCEYVDCKIGEASGSFSPFKGYDKCPDQNEMDQVKDKCTEKGGKFVIVYEGGCKFAKCVEQSDNRCGLVPGPERERIENECKGKGLGVIKDYDEKGCQYIKCGNQENCGKDPPKEVFDKCRENGGEMIVKRDYNGCVGFSECVKRGDQQKMFVESVSKVPEQTDLLAIAFKLENLKVQLDKQSIESGKIADYYKSIGSKEENRFRRVSDMFKSAESKVNEIKNKLRSKVRDMTIDDVNEIKYDLKYLKDVVINDIVYVMLSTDDDMMEIVNSSVKNCGTDGQCFDDGFRLCKQLVFLPEGKSGPYVEVTGLEDGKCVMKITIPESMGPPKGSIPGLNPPYSTLCKIEKYSLGVRNPDDDVLPYCEGPVGELMRKYGTGSKNDGSDNGGNNRGNGPQVPGVCNGADDCRNKCGRTPENAKKCLEYLGKFMPDDVKSQLSAIASGSKTIPPQQQSQKPIGNTVEQIKPISIEDSPIRSTQQSSSGGSGGSATSGGGFSSSSTSSSEGSSSGFESSASSGGSGQQCSGCFNNGICDFGECSTCQDCRR